MTFTEAAAEVLRLVGKPLHYKDITEIAIQKNLLSHVGKSPEVTMGSRLAALLKKGPKENPLVRVKPGVFALRAWEEGGPPGPAPEGSVAAPAVIADAEAVEGEATDDSEVVTPPAPPARSSQQIPMKLPEVHEERAEPAADERMRADLAAGASDIFGEEDDDDQPILGAEAGPDAAGARRRRRRRRGRGGDSPARPESADGLPSYTVSPAFGEGSAQPAPREGNDTPPADGQEARHAPREGGQGQNRRENNREGRDRNRDRGDRGDRTEHVENRETRGGGQDGVPVDGDELAGRDMVDVVITLLNGFDRNGGPVAFRAIADAALRRGRISGDAQQLQSQIAASIRADNLRRQAEGRRARFRIAGGRVALSDWSMPPDLLRLESDAMAAVERYREGVRRALTRKISELPPHGFAELVITLLERLGLSQIKAVRRPGAAGGEAHFSALSRGPAGDVRVAVVIRKDAREIGRERVIEMRGALHHYGPAWGAWLITAGHALSGAREEATAPGALPVHILDGNTIAKLCEEQGLGVIKTTVPICIPDADLFEGLRGG